MYEKSADYTWWDIEDNVGPLALQAVNRWEALNLPQDATEVPAVLRVWMTSEEGIMFTVTLFHEDMEVYTAEGEIKISGVPRPVAAKAVENTILESAVGLVGESVANKLVRGLLPWLHQQ